MTNELLKIWEKNMGKPITDPYILFSMKKAKNR